jgi:hypothetical protein
MEMPMAMDAVRHVYDHLVAIQKAGGKPAIDLFIHSNGGEGTVPWRLVTLIREYTDKFSVLVPHRAFSAATLTALGADSIVMHPMGMLGPTDPTVTNAFNPVDPTNPQQRLGISVEDVTAFIALIKEDAGIQHEDELVQAFNKLSDHVHPLALGNVKRSLSQSRMMAAKLLRLHMDDDDRRHKVQGIVDNLTSKLFFHGHPINRKEATDQIGLTNVEIPPVKVEKAMWSLYLEYEKELQMHLPFDHAGEYLALAQAPTIPPPAPAPGTPPAPLKTPKKTAKLGVIESLTRTDICSMDYELAGQSLPNGATAVTMIMTRRAGWQKE